jgi:citrate synthase
MILFDQIAAQLPVWRERVSRLKKDHGTFKIGDVTVDQIYSGIRDVQIQVSDISYVDPREGIRLRGYTIPELMALLPKAEGSDFPLAGGLYYLLMVDAIPNQAQAQAVEEEWKRRSAVPGQVYDVIRAMPPDTHPMTLFSQAILALQPQSVFARRYTRGMQKVDYWDAYLEDSLNLTAKLPTIAAYIYNYRYRGGVESCSNPMIDWSADFACMIGKSEDEYKDMSRLFFMLHSDHEGANVSAHTAHLVGSALSDVYYSCSAGMDGLAGPLHGLANQECLLYLLGVQEHFNGVLPTREQYAAYAWEQLQAGKVIPGYGHAVLRAIDPRFTAQLEFGKNHFPDDPVFQLVNIVFETLPGVLSRYGKVKNPWPNVDAINGTMQYHYGVREIEFYTVLFGVSRILGLTAHLVWSRALGKPIERPKSLTTRMLEEMVVEEKV